MTASIYYICVDAGDYAYDIERVKDILTASGVSNLHLSASEHGATIYGRKAP
jgi:hypothetical protein